MTRGRGFTLIELSFVVAIIGILASMAIPKFVVYQSRAKAAEALINVETIAYLQQVRILETGQPIDCESLPAKVPGRKAVPFYPTQSWKDLGLQIEGRVYFQYETKKTGDKTFEVIARGDLDGDTELSEYRLDSKSMDLTSKNPGE